jgi:hypothetical protein
MWTVDRVGVNSRGKASADGTQLKDQLGTWGGKTWLVVTDVQSIAPQRSVNDVSWVAYSWMDFSLHKWHFYWHARWFYNCLQHWVSLGRSSHPWFQKKTQMLWCSSMEPIEGPKPLRLECHLSHCRPTFIQILPHKTADLRWGFKHQQKHRSGDY